MQSVLEELKQQPSSIEVSFALLGGQFPPPVYHFGLHVIEFRVKYVFRAA